MDLEDNTALPAKEGITEMYQINVDAIRKIKQKQKEGQSAENLFRGILTGNITSLSQGITLVESTNENHQREANLLIEKCLNHGKETLRIGISGVPGAGKSTFIECFGNWLTKQGKRVAVLAVDPSSSVTHGSILGDKTRMETLSKNPNAYIRPSAAGATLGGVAKNTREAIVLCEAAGFDCILIETVGVGQSETLVHGMVDVFVMLQVTGTGDELQGIKKGIIEMADIILINKADNENLLKAKKTKVDLTRVLHFLAKKPSSWEPQVLLCSALYEQGIVEFWQTIEQYLKQTKENGHFDLNRQKQNQFWLIDGIKNQLLNDFFEDLTIKDNLELMKKKVNLGEISPFRAAKDLVSFYHKKHLKEE